LAGVNTGANVGVTTFCVYVDVRSHFSLWVLIHRTITVHCMGFFNKYIPCMYVAGSRGVSAPVGPCRVQFTMSLLEQVTQSPDVYSLFTFCCVKLLFVGTTASLRKPCFSCGM
jgi:hypothetical protein